jgi:hypothetical protein
MPKRLRNQKASHQPVTGFLLSACVAPYGLPLSRNAFSFRNLDGWRSLPQRLRFDLADEFARDGESLADLFERMLAAVRAQSEAHLDDLLFAEAATSSIGGLLELKGSYLAQPSSKIQTENISNTVTEIFDSNLDGMLQANRCCQSLLPSD